MEIKDPTAPWKTKQVWTYGGFLFANSVPWSHVDDELLQTVAQCLCDDPADRPSLYLLERIIKRNLFWSKPNETDEDVRKWAEQSFTGVPESGLRPLAGLKDVSNPLFFYLPR